MFDDILTDDYVWVENTNDPNHEIGRESYFYPEWADDAEKRNQFRVRHRLWIDAHKIGPPMSTLYDLGQFTLEKQKELIEMGLIGLYKKRGTDTIPAPSEYIEDWEYPLC